MMRRDPLADPATLIRRVYSFVAYRIGDGPDAEDVTSEVFERAVRYRHTYDAGKGEPAAWLIGIARTCVAGHAGALNQRRAELVDWPSAQEGLEDEAVRRLTIAAAVARLPERDRELIALRYGADLTTRQIGRLVGLKTNAVEVALHRALGRLRSETHPPSAEPPPALQVVRV
jgi:RNA polymerase sigma-70 factor (ECF subfamily)